MFSCEFSDFGGPTILQGLLGVCDDPLRVLRGFWPFPGCGGGGLVGCVQGRGLMVCDCHLGLLLHLLMVPVGTMGLCWPGMALSGLWGEGGGGGGPWGLWPGAGARRPCLAFRGFSCSEALVALCLWFRFWA